MTIQSGDETTCREQSRQGSKSPVDKLGRDQGTQEIKVRRDQGTQESRYTGIKVRTDQGTQRLK